MFSVSNPIVFYLVVLPWGNSGSSLYLLLNLVEWGRKILCYKTANITVTVSDWIFKPWRSWVSLGIVTHTLNPAFERQGQVDLWVGGHPGLDSELLANQGYIVKPCLKKHTHKIIINTEAELTIDAEGQTRRTMAPTVILWSLSLRSDSIWRNTRSSN